jgi:uncharacterized protein (TIGR02271 family)
VKTRNGAGGLPARDARDLPGRKVYDLEGQKIGTAASLYVSDRSGAAEWVTVKTGLFGGKESFVPLAGARTDDAGLHVRTRKDVVKDAPQAGDEGHLSDQEIVDLYRHYGLQPGAAVPQGETTPAESLVRSEERMRVGTETAEAGRVRLRKYIVTEEQQVNVPVRHEEVHVTREPVSPEEAQAAGDIGEEEREVVLHEERPVVAKETVPVEKVGLSTETVQEEHQISGTVRKEQVDVDDDTGRSR